MPGRRRTASEQVSAAVLTAAEAVLDRDGADGVTVRAVAAEAQVAPMSVYNRFASKSGLLDAVALRAFDDLAAAIAVPSAVAPPARLRRACHGYRDYALAHPARYLLIFSTGSPAAETTSPVAQRGREVFITLVDMVGAVAPAEATDVVELAQALWSSLHGAVTIHLAGVGQTPDAGKAFDTVLDMAIRGIETDPAPRPGPAAAQSGM